MRYLGAAVVFLLGMALHWWWCTYFTFWGLAPQLLLILTVAIAATSGPVAGQCYGFAWGLVLDVAGVRLFGANALALTVSAYAVGNARRQMDVSSPLSQAMVVAAVSLCHLLSLAALGLLFEHQAFWSGWSTALVTPVVNCVAAPLLFPLVQRAVDL
ncbi:MAG: rod shape-determining protein MreD [Elusimicrobia bacterium]|nr:rod shape-determining protein MreD [Elusimicrobiota bacterium]